MGTDRVAQDRNGKIDLIFGSKFIDKDVVVVVIEQLRAGASSVEALEDAHIISVILKATARSEVVSLSAVKLSCQDLPFLVTDGFQFDGDLD